MPVQRTIYKNQNSNMTIRMTGKLLKLMKGEQDSLRLVLKDGHMVIAVKQGEVHLLEAGCDLLVREVEDMLHSIQHLYDNLYRKVFGQSNIIC